MQEQEWAFVLFTTAKEELHSLEYCPQASARGAKKAPAKEEDDSMEMSPEPKKKPEPKKRVLAPKQPKVLDHLCRFHQESSSAYTRI